MAELLRQRTTNILHPSQIYAIDELLVGFRSRKSKLVVKIPRKPNSVGYLIYIMSTVSQIYNLPYAIDCFPVVKDIHTKFDFQMNGFVDCLLASYPSLKNRVHLVTDSAFGTYTIIQTQKLKGIFMTSSMKFQMNKKIWDVMRYSLSGYYSGRTLYWKRAVLMYNLIAYSKEMRLLSAGFSVLDTKNQNANTFLKVKKEISKFQQKVTNFINNRTSLLHYLSSQPNKTSNSLRQRVSSVISSLKKINCADNKLFKTTLQKVDSVIWSVDIKKVEGISPNYPHQYSVILSNGERANVQAMQMINFNGHVHPALLNVVTREQLKQHFLDLDLDSLK